MHWKLVMNWLQHEKNTSDEVLSKWEDGSCWFYIFLNWNMYEEYSWTIGYYLNWNFNHIYYILGTTKRSKKERIIFELSLFLDVRFIYHIFVCLCEIYLKTLKYHTSRFPDYGWRRDETLSLAKLCKWSGFLRNFLILTDKSLEVSW